jgi:hypothetical protein
MKKQILAAGFILATNLIFAQMSFGIKANAIYPTEKTSLKSIDETINTTINNNGKGYLGYNVGAFVKIKLGSTFFVMPEAYYTTFSKEYVINNNTTVKETTNRADVPVLLGLEVFKMLDVYAGPVAKYTLSTKNQWEDLKENGAKNFNLGYQMGVGLNVSNIIISLRYEGSFDDKQKEFINQNTNSSFKYDSGTSLLLAGVGINF